MAKSVALPKCASAALVLKSKVSTSKASNHPESLVLAASRVATPSSRVRSRLFGSWDSCVEILGCSSQYEMCVWRKCLTLLLLPLCDGRPRVVGFRNLVGGYMRDLGAGTA